MSSFVFNDFKRRYLNGEVPSADNWTFIPVNDTFKTEFEFKDNDKDIEDEEITLSPVKMD